MDRELLIARATVEGDKELQAMAKDHVEIYKKYKASIADLNETKKEYLKHKTKFQRHLERWAKSLDKRPKEDKAEDKKEG